MSRRGRRVPQDFERSDTLASAPRAPCSDERLRAGMLAELERLPSWAAAFALPFDECLVVVGSQCLH